MRFEFDPNGAVIGRTGTTALVICATDVEGELYQGASITLGTPNLDPFEKRLTRDQLIEKLVEHGADQSELESKLDQLRSLYQ